jgi:hypothetical protein
VLRQAAIEQAQRIGSGRSPLIAAMCREFGVQTPPLRHLADRITAFWAEDLGWREPDAAATLSHSSQILRLGTVNDDRERLRSWFFWLLVLSEDPTDEQVKQWKAGVEEALAPLLTYESAMMQTLGIISDDKSKKLDLLKAIVSLFNERVAEQLPTVAEEWADAALRGFSDPLQQAEAMIYVAEACLRMGDEIPATTFAATADALMPGFIELADRRMAIVRLVHDGEHQALREWPNAASFAEAFASLLDAYATRKDFVGLLGLTESLRNVPESWSTLLIALCGTQVACEDVTALGEALLSDLKQYDKREVFYGKE